MAEFSQRQDGNRAYCMVRGELNIYSASQARDQLLHSLADSVELSIDLAGVSDFDSSGVQILLLLRREAQRLGKPLAFIHHSPTVREVLDLLNLGGELGDPLVIPLSSQGECS